MNPRFDEELLRQLKESAEATNLQFFADLNRFQMQLAQANTEKEFADIEKTIADYLDARPTKIENAKKFAEAYQYIEDQLNSPPPVSEAAKKQIPSAYSDPRYQVLLKKAGGSSTYSPIEFMQEYKEIIAAIKDHEKTELLLSNPFLNYRLNELIKLKDTPRNRDLVEDINNAIAKNEFDAAFKKISTRITTEENKAIKQNKSEIDRINKQVSHYSRIINPEIVKLLAGSSYLKSTQFFFLTRTSTKSQIDALNAAIFTKADRNDQFDEIKDLLDGIGLSHVNHEQIQHILDENASLRRKANSEDSPVKDESDKVKLKWLKEHIASPLNPAFLASPDILIKRQIDMLIGSSAGNFVIKQTMPTMYTNTFNSLKNKILISIQIAIASTNPKATIKVDVKRDAELSKQMTDWAITQPKDFSLYDLIKSGVDKSIPEETAKQLAKLAQDELGKQYKTQLQHLYQIDFLTDKQKSTAYKILNDLLDNHIELEDYKWQTTLLLRNIQLDSARLQSLVDKILRNDKSDYLDELLRNNYIKTDDLSKIYKQMVDYKIGNATTVQLFIQSQEKRLERKQKEILAKLNLIQDELEQKEPGKYNQLKIDLEADANKFNSWQSKTAPQLQEFAKSLTSEKIFQGTEKVASELEKYKGLLEEKIKEQASPQEQEERKVIAQKMLSNIVAEIDKYFSDFANDMKKFSSYLYDENDKLTYKNLRKEVKNEDTVTYPPIDIPTDDQQKLFNGLLQPFKQLRESLLPNKPQEGQAREYLEYFIHQLENSSELTLALIEAASSQENINEFLATNHIYGIQEEVKKEEAVEAKEEKKVIVNTFNTYAIKPTQIIAKIPLLLSEALKYIDKKDPLYKEAKDALEFSKKLASNTNETVRSRARTVTSQAAVDDLINSIQKNRPLLIKKINHLQFDHKEQFISLITDLAKVEGQSNIIWLYKIKNTFAVLAQANSADEMLNHFKKLITDPDIQKVIKEGESNPLFAQVTKITKFAATLKKEEAANAALEKTSFPPSPYGQLIRNPQKPEAPEPTLEIDDKKVELEKKPPSPYGRAPQKNPMGEATHDPNIGTSPNRPIIPAPYASVPVAPKKVEVQPYHTMLKVPLSMPQTAKPPKSEQKNSPYGQLTKNLGVKTQERQAYKSSMARLLKDMQQALAQMEQPLITIQKSFNTEPKMGIPQQPPKTHHPSYLGNPSKEESLGSSFNSLFHHEIAHSAAPTTGREQSSVPTLKKNGNEKE